MDNKELAKTILARRESSMSPIIMPGEIQAQLGADGYAEALRQRWLEPNWDTGHVQITNNMTLVDQMRSMRESLLKEDAYNVGDTVTVADGGQAYTGVVSERKPDGTYSVTFADGQAPRMPRAYRAEEFQLVQTTPAAPAGATGSGASRPAPRSTPAPTAGAAPSPTPSGGAGRSLTPGVGRT